MLLSYVHPCILIACIIVLILFSSRKSYAQAPSKLDSGLHIPKSEVSHFPDSGKQIIDTTLKNTKKYLSIREKSLTGAATTKYQLLKKGLAKSPFEKDSLSKENNCNNPYTGLMRFSKPVFRIDGGYIAYNFNYRSNTDTPYAEKNVFQHMVNGSLNFSIAQNLPFSANIWIRRSNSAFFTNITDVQISFNSAAFHNQLTRPLKERFSSQAGGISDSLGNLYSLKKKQALDTRNWLTNPFQLQKLIQANETVQVPQKNFDPSLSDSVNNKRTDSLQRLAKDFIAKYSQEKERYDKLEREQDSLGKAYHQLKGRIQRYQEMLKGGDQNTSALKSMEDSLKAYGGNTTPMPASYKWLLGIKNFSLGRTPVNYSELTVKNVSLTGVNLEYNSWYYLAACAGSIDYRFHDFVVNRNGGPRQYLYMLRAGIGRLEHNYFIMSLYKGQKQLYTSATSTGPVTSISVLGFAAETKWYVNKYTYAIAEVAESLAPDYRSTPATPAKFDFTNKTNKALSLKLYTYLPVTATRLEGMYKYAGGNFQSFSSFQSNADLKTWYIKADQFFWKRKLKITASLRSNDFYNPYIVQNYQSNTVFKSISASFRTRGLPTLMIGYMPMSQLTAVGTQIIENRFQTLTANINHYYRIGSIRATTTAVLNKFYNNSTDTSFVFYNATNLLMEQSLLFTDFTANINFSRSVSSRYELNVAGEEVSFPFSRRGSMGFGVKLNNFNKTQNKIGELFNINYQLGSMDYLSLNIERGYLPGSSGALIHNDFGNVQFIKRFK